MREFVLSTDRPDWIESFDHALQKAVTDHTVQVMADRAIPSGALTRSS